MKTPDKLSFFSVLLIFVGLLFAAGCTLDFDDFETAGEFGDDVGTDTDPDTEDDTNDTTTDPGGIGAACDGDDQCLDGTCVESVCLTECDDGQCPSGARCFQMGSDQWCAPRCRDTHSCDHIDDNDELECVFLVETEEFGASPHRLSRACLPDSAGDRVFDGLDNCPHEPNPAQIDSAGDGIGDACSETPYCHSDAVDGVLDFEAVDFRAGDFSIPHVVDDRWLAVVGTVDDEASPDSPLALLDRHTGQWQQRDALEFPGHNRFVVATNTGGFLISPGVRDDGVDGGWTHVSNTGDVSYGPDYDPYPSFFYDIAQDAVPVRFSNGEIHRLLYRENADSLLIQYELSFGFAPMNDDLTFFSHQDVDNRITDSEMLTYDDAFQSPPQTIRHPDGRVGVALWQQDQSQLHLVELTAPNSAPNSQARLHSLEIPDQWEYEDEEDANGDEPDGNGDEPDGNGDEPDGNGDEPDDNIDDLSEFEPIAVPAPGGQLYVFDRNTGKAGRFIAEFPDGAASDATSLYQRSWNEFERIPEYDLEDFEDFSDLSVYLLPDARGFGIVGRPAVEDDEEVPETLEVRELYFACHPMTDDVDTADDGIGQFIDNCPGHQNPDQADLDGDSWGDVCDPDIDGDGIPNDEDFVEVDSGDGENGEDGDGENGGDGDPQVVDQSRDSNNDTVPNDDTDDADGDGIPDQFDPFPLDSSNDGTVNFWTDDASGNEFTDQSLRDAALDPYSFFSLPTGHDFVYAVDDSGQRSLYSASLDDAANSSRIELPDDLNPHQISYEDSTTLYFLAAPPEQTARFATFDLQEGVVGVDIELDETTPFLDIRSVSRIDETAIDWLDEDDVYYTVVHRRPESDGWMISEVTETAGGYDRDGFEAVNAAFEHFWHAHLHDVGGDEVLFFVAAESDCRPCATAYYYHFETGNLEIVDGLWDGIDVVSTHRSSLAFTTPGPDAVAGSIHYLNHGQTPPYATTDVDDQFEEFLDLAFSYYDDSFAPFDGRPFVIASASRWGQTADVWLHLPHLSESIPGWRLLIADERPIVETAWLP